MTLVVTTPADAALLQFTISGTDTLSPIDPTFVEFASFQLDSNPLIDAVNVSPDQGFAIANVTGIFQYGPITLSSQSISFFTTALGGGLLIGDGTDNGTLLGFDGPQLYIGTEAQPEFLTGSFDLTDFVTGSPISLTISTVSAIPEPASWAMMLAGFAMVGGATRYRRRKAIVAYA
ncbi:PEPxxWA-CTERM sorting domain-containing protein [Sphingomonas mollis]|nr:PEPxxWA-CTERM sorting domain-containing protein [Sphingomonas sp. BT553]